VIESAWFKNLRSNEFNVFVPLRRGLMLLEGKGIYRLNDKWYSVQAGDVIWMAPYVTQW
jgi:glyoxylate utilization-related uncharacterized protein